VSRYVIGITGASGSCYAARLLPLLLGGGNVLHVVASEQGKAVFAHETGNELPRVVEELQEQYGAGAQETGSITLHADTDLFAPIASGSYRTHGMVVVPCSMASLGEMTHGSGKGLLARAADVTLKEHRTLVVVPRESPVGSIHLENMLALSNHGAVILPAMPGFYHHPRTVEDLVDFVVGRILDALGIENTLTTPWKGVD